MTAEDAIATIPKRIKVGSFVYTVELVDKVDDEESDAQILAEQLLIQVRRSSPDPAYLAASILHELLHALWTERNLPDSADEETVVGHMERGLSLLIQDNPRPISWLIKCLKAGSSLK